MADPTAGSPWSAPGMVAGFAQSPPNAALMQYAEQEQRRTTRPRGLDIGCGAGRNAVPLARQGWHVLGVDDSWAMLRAGTDRARADGVESRVCLARAGMDEIPIVARSIDLVIAHGIWNLASSAHQFRRPMREASRIARPRGGPLRVHLLAQYPAARSGRVAGEPFVFMQFSGQPQCFLTEAQLLEEMAAAGFVPDSAVPLTEHDRPRPGTLRTGSRPVIYEAAFRYGP